MLCYFIYIFFFFYGSGDHRDLPVLTHSFPTRRSSDLGRIGADERDRRLGGLQVQKPVALGEIEELALPMVQPAFWCVGLLIRLDPEIEAGQIWRLFHAFRSEEHTSELQSLMRISYAVFCLKKKQPLKEKMLTINILRKHINKN